MKKVTLLSTLFLTAFGITLGIVAFLAPPAHACIPCPQPICEVYCSPETGPLCTNPTYPYYRYAINCECPHGPGSGHCQGIMPDQFKGCCRIPG